MKPLLFVLLGIMTLSGCSVTPIETVSLAAWDGDHRRSIKTFEAEIKQFDHWANYGTSGLFGPFARYGMIHLCESYLQIRDFTKARACANAWKKDGYQKTLADFGEQEAQLKLNHFETFYYLELGDFENAYQSYRLARRSNDQRSGDPCKSMLGVSRLVRMDANGAIAAAKLGKQQEAMAIAHNIDCITPWGLELETGSDVKQKNASKAGIYLALGEYDKAEAALIHTPLKRDYVRRGYMAFMTLGLTELIDRKGSITGDSITNPFSFNEQAMLAKIALGNGEHIKAKAIIQSLLYKPNSTDISAAIENRPGIHYQMLFDLGFIAEQEGDEEQAIALYQQSVDIIEDHRRTINTEASKIGFIGDKEAVYYRLVGVLIKQARLAEALSYAERSKARALVDTLASKQQLAAKGDQDSSSILVQLNELDTQLMTADYTQGATRVRSVDRGLLRKKRKQLQKSQPELASLVTVSAPDIQQLRQLLRPDETLVEFYGYGDRLFLFLLTHDSITAVNMSAAGLDQQILAFRESLLEPGSERYKVLAHKIYQHLFGQHVRAQLRTPKLVIVPHGALHYLPFSALHDGYRFLVDNFEMSILPSASVMTFLGRESNAQGEMLLLGNPELGDSRLALPGAEREARAIAKQLSNKTLLIGKKASETAVKQHGAGFKYLHFASHGIFNPESPLSSGLLLAQDEHNDGTLTVAELYELNLNAELVTLSACETGLGKVANGDDVVGFTRAFLYAGTNSIISSLWKVDDESTSQLMQNFYARLQGDKDKRSALRQAQLEVKQGKYSHPYYWAAFQLTGH